VFRILNTMKKIILGTIIVAVLGLGAWYYFGAENVKGMRPLALSAENKSFHLELGNNNGTDTVWDTSGDENNGIEVGTVTFTNDYVDLPGTNDNYIIASSTGVYNTANVAMVYVFQPDFAASDDIYSVLFGSDSGKRYGIHKSADAQSNVMYLLMGDTVMTAIPLATYEDYWKANEVNVIIVDGTSGDTDVYLNGTQIKTNDATAWTPQNPTNIYLGASNTGGSALDGKMLSFTVFQRRLTADEITRYSANRATSIRTGVRDNMLGYWNFDTHDVNGFTVYDKSRYGDNGTIVNATAETDDCVLGECFDYDGDEDYIALDDTNLNALFSPTKPFSISVWYKQDVKELASILGYYDAPKYLQLLMLNDTGQLLARVGAGSGGSLPTITSGVGYNDPDTWYHVVYTYDGTSRFYLYINNVQVGTVNAAPSAFNSTKNIHVGGLNHTAPSSWDGKIDELKIFNRVLSASERTSLYNATKLIKINTSTTWYVR
jgi:hypothetical protein